MEVLDSLFLKLLFKELFDSLEEFILHDIFL